MTTIEATDLTITNTLSEVLHAIGSTGTWVENFYVSLSRLGDTEQVLIIDGRNAFRNKAVCPTYRIEGRGWHECPVLNSDWAVFDLEILVDLLEEVECEPNFFGSFKPLEADGLTLHRYDENAKRVFNPNALDRLKRVTKLNDKINLPTVVKLIANDQVTCFRDQKLTDDYAGDAADNFGKGGYPALALAERLVSSPSGWRAYRDGNDTIRVCCHHFEYHTLTITDKKLL